jgi:hypothetical protein
MIDDEFLSQFPSMHNSKRLGIVIPVSKSIERCKREMPVLEAEQYLASGDYNRDATQEKLKGEVLVQRKTRDGELKTFNPLHFKNLKSQRRV